MESTLFEGMFLYEITLLLLGVLLFLVMIVILVIKASTRQPIMVVIPFFIIPVLMVGFPGIQNFKFMNGLAEVEMRSDEIARGQENAELRSEQRRQLELLSLRPIRHPDNQFIMAEAFEAIGDLEEAKHYNELVIEQQPDNRDANRLQSRLFIQENIDRIRANPQDVQASRNIRNEISTLENKSELKTQDLIMLSRGNQAIGDTQRARMYEDSVRIINPGISIP
jgi:hypothetical protein